MKLGYNTNGLAHHRLTDAIELLADLGYQSVAITLDSGAWIPTMIPPRSIGSSVWCGRCPGPHRHGVRDRDRGRYLLNPRKKHDPTLMDPDPAQGHSNRLLRRAIDLAAAMGSQAVSLWSGCPTAPIEEGPGMDRLADGLKSLLDYAEQAHIPLAFEPEPGMFIDTLDRFSRLDERLEHPLFQLTLDLGHVHCLDEGDIPALLRSWSERIVNIHIEDMKKGTHEHLMFGEGTMDFPSICAALGEIGYSGPVHVELSRHSHLGHDAAQRAANFLKPLLLATPSRG